MKKIVALVLSLVMVLGLATTAFGAVAPELKAWDNDAKAGKGDWVDAGFTLTGDIADYALDTDDGFLPCYMFESTGGSEYYFVESTAAAADHKLVYGATTVYLTYVPNSDKIAFEAKASVLEVVDADDAVCGDFAVVDLSAKDTYYVSYDKKTGLPNGFYKADKSESTNVLVDGKLVAVEVLTDEVTFVKHEWVGYDVVNYAYTTVKCDECGNVAKLFANATAAGKKSVKVEVDGDVLGWITAADANNFGAAVEAPATDKVESAQTFDAGIAMYVGMSVMAAAGSAVVLKKKD